MFKLIICFVLLLTVKLYSGGVCIDTWKTDRVSYGLYENYAYFRDVNRGEKITIAGTFTVTDDDIKRKGKRK